MSAGDPQQHFDLIIRSGTIYDGSGGPPVSADIACAGDRIARIGTLPNATAATEIHASGLAVAPGFVNMLSHSYYSMIMDPRSLGELKQGVTLQVMGEGTSMGPLTPPMREAMQEFVSRWVEPSEMWDSLAGYLRFMEKRGISQNITSYIGATSLRSYAVGQDDRPATPREMDTMRSLVRDEMSAGALGIGSSLIYPPAFYAPTEELIELCAAAAPYDGKYISHMRSESTRLVEAVQELLRISREGGVRAEIYHLKAAGRENWHKMDAVIEMIEAARARGEPIGADMYLYDAGATGLSACIPPRYHDGGPAKLLERLEDPAARAEIRAEITSQSTEWENMYVRSGPEGILILSVRKPENRRFQGRRLTEVADMLGSADPLDALLELVRLDRSRISTAYFMISEENIRKEAALPWVTFGSDSPSTAAEGDFLLESTHPRAYGNFARLLGRYVRDEKLVSLPEAVRRLAALPCENLGIRDRGRIAAGFFADIVVFDPETVRDHATYEQPHQYAEGIRDVIVNGVAALRGGDPTGHLPGRAVYGPGRKA